MKKSIVLVLMLMQALFVCAQCVTLGESFPLKKAETSCFVEAQGKGNAAITPVVSPMRILASTERGVGYTDGDSITIKGVRVGQAGTYRVLAILPSTSLSAYAGCKIVGLRFALSQSIGKTTAFLYSVKDGEATEIQTVNVRRTVDGWNEVRFNASQEYTIGGNVALMYGFAYNESEDMVAAGEGALCFYLPQKADDSASQIEKDNGFYTMSDFGNLCVQLIVDVSSLPKKAVTMTTLLSGNKYHKAGSLVDAFVMYDNTGLEDISSLRVGYRIDDGEPAYVDDSNALKVGTSGSVNPQFTLPEDLASGKHTLSFFVDKIDGNPSSGAATDTISEDFVVYRQSTQRNCNYIEQYNSQESYLGAQVNSQMNSGSAKDGVALVNLYRDGEPLAVDASLAVTELYAYTTPCFTVDRFYMMGEKYVAFDVNDYVNLLPQFWSTLIAPLVSEADANPCFSTLALEPQYDASSRTLTLGVSGKTVDELPQVVGDLSLTLMLVEDKVVSEQKVLNGATIMTDRNYSHDNVLRNYITPVNGERLDVADGCFSANFKYVVPETYNTSNLKVVALLTKWLPEITDSNMLDADVFNAATVTVPADASGINSVSGDNTSTLLSDGVYTLSGVKIPEARMTSGVYVVRSGGKSHKVIVK